MATGFRNRAGADWEDLFEPEVGGNGVGDPKFRRSNGSIIRFAKRSLGTAVANVEAGRTDGQGDAATLWAKKGSVAYLNTNTNGTLTFQGLDVGVWCSGVTYADRLTAKFTMYVYSDGRWALYAMSSNYKNDNVWQYGVGSSSPRTADNSSTPFLVSSGTWAKNVGAGVGASYLVDATMVGEAGDPSGVVRYGWRDYYSTNSGLYTDHYPGFRGNGTVHANGGVNLGTNLSLGTTRVFEFSLDVTGVTGNSSLKDRNSGLSWFNRSRLYLTIKNAAAPSIAATGGMLMLNAIRWNSSSYPTISRTSGGGSGGGGGTGGGSCPVIEAIMYDGTTAGDYTVGRTLMVTDPYQSDANSTTGDVLASERSLQPCVRVTCADGTVIECSTTAPIPTRDKGFVKAPALLGEYMATAAADDLNGENTPFDWSEVVTVEDIGDRLVQKLFVENRCFWISKDGKRFGLHHNLKPADEL